MLVFRAGRQPVILRGADRIDVDDVLPGFPLTVEGLFRAILPDWLDEPPKIEQDEQPVAGAQADEDAASGRSEDG